jgi:NAD(P)H-hydrate repair Nnr-like enzyme with NAD(P)H-hydrate dehydratase domain
MAHLSGASKDEVSADPAPMALRMARHWQATVALKGPTTFIATPEGQAWKHEGGNVGLAASGSGDTLAGIIVGLAARGATLAQAGAWGVALHARAGAALGAAGLSDARPGSRSADADAQAGNRPGISQQ